MLAQLVNFAIVFFVLWRFALKPLMKTMGERTATIEKSLHDAKEIERRVQETDAAVAQRITESRAQSLAILNDAKKAAESHRQSEIAKAKQEVEGIVADARTQIRSEKEQMLADAHAELAGLVAKGISRVLEKTNDETTDRQLVKAIIDKL